MEELDVQETQLIIVNDIKKAPRGTLFRTFRLNNCDLDRVRASVLHRTHFPRHNLFLTLAVVGLFGDADLGGFSNGFVLGDQNLSLPEMIDDLLLGVAFPRHEIPFRMIQSLIHDLDLF